MVTIPVKFFILLSIVLLLTFDVSVLFAVSMLFIVLSCLISAWVKHKCLDGDLLWNLHETQFLLHFRPPGGTKRIMSNISLGFQMQPKDSCMKIQ